MLAYIDLMLQAGSAGNPMPSNPIARFQRTYMSYGDWLGEWFYGFVMVSVMTGIVSSFSVLGFGKIGIDRSDATIILLILTFGVNVSWGLIDGSASIYGGLVDKADQDKLINQLKKDSNNKDLRSKLLDSLEDSPAEYLTEEEKEQMLDRIITEAPEAKPRYRFTKEDRNTLIATASCDILAVIPVILPFLLFGFGHIPLTLSRFIAAFAIGSIVFLYAEHTGRRKYLAGTIFAILTVVVMWITYYYGW